MACFKMAVSIGANDVNRGGDRAKLPELTRRCVGSSSQRLRSLEFRSGRGWDAAVVLIVLVFTGITRWPTIFVPQIDWDEGNRMSIGSALANGRTLYVDAWDHHTFLDILFFEQLFRWIPNAVVPVVVRIVNAAIAAAVPLLVYFGISRISRQPSPDQATSPERAAVDAWAIAAAGVAAFLFSRPWAMSTTGEFYHSLPVAGAFFLAFAKSGRRCVGAPVRQCVSAVKLASAGVLFAIAFFTKQTAVFDLAAFGLLVFIRSWITTNENLTISVTERLMNAMKRASNFLLYPAIGFGAFTVLCAVYFVAQGSWREALYTMFVDPLIYTTGRDAPETIGKYGSAAGLLFSAVSTQHGVISFGTAASYIILLAMMARGRWRTPSGWIAAAAGIWLLVNALGLALIGRFYSHYLVQLIVPLSIFSTFAVTRIAPPASIATAIAVMAMLLGVSGIRNIDQLARNASGAARRLEHVAATADFVKANTEENDTIFLYQNWALCLYYLTERFPPTKVFMDHQLLPENKDAPRLLPEALRALRERPPKFIITGSLGRNVPEIDAFVAQEYLRSTNFGPNTIYSIRKRTYEDSAPPK